MLHCCGIRRCPGGCPLPRHEEHPRFWQQHRRQRADAAPPRRRLRRPRPLLRPHRCASWVQASPSKPSSCPVVFKLHGSGGGVRSDARSDFTTRGSIGVYPQGSNLPDTPGWNLGARTNLNCASHDFDCTKDPNEGQYFADIIAALRTHGVAGNMYAYGTSNGSSMAHRLGINGGSALSFKGIVTTASQMLDKPARSGPGTYNYNQPQQGEAAVCILGINGDADGLIPIEGGPLFTNKEHFAFKSADASSRAWADHNGCKASSPATTAETHSSSTVTHAVYDCPAAAHVEHYTVHGAGHTGADKNLWPAILDFIAACEAGQTGATPTMGNPASSPSSLASTTESMASQATDAPETALPFVCASGQTSRCCGDGVCDGPETAALCPADCGTSKATAQGTTEATAQGTTKASTMTSVALTTQVSTTGSAAWSLGDLPTLATSDWVSNYAENGTEKLIWREDATIKNFQPPMPLPFNAMATSSGCPHTTLVEGSYKRWEDTTLQWPGRSTQGPPTADGLDVILPSGMTILVGASSFVSTATRPYGKITIPSSSRIVFDDTGAGGSAIDLDVLSIAVSGVVEAGSPTCRVEGKITITLHGEHGNHTSTSDRHLFTGQNDPSLKGIVVATGGRLDIHGALFFPTWTRLAGHTPGTIRETQAPASRNLVLFLQDCVNWVAGQRIVVTTTHHKDTRGYHYNEERTIASGGTKCLTVDGREYGQITVTEPLTHYHHAGRHEYQAEVGLLSRNIVIQGNNRSDPTDNTPLQCDAERNYGDLTTATDAATRTFVRSYKNIPCRKTFLTGFGGHVMLTGASRIAGVEFWRMGQTNVLGRYPVHFHRNLKGNESYAVDCSVHRSYYRAIVVHDTQEATVSRNVAYDIAGHAYYLESGVEENNVISYNLAAHVHCIDGCAIMKESSGEIFANKDRIVPADATASGFYVSNAANTLVANAASGGWAGFQFPVIPESIDRVVVSRTDTSVSPLHQPMIKFSGNSAHSTAWWGKNIGALYVGGALFFDDWTKKDQDQGIASKSDILVYSPGRVNRRAPIHYTEHNFENLTLALVGGGVAGWMFQSDYTHFDGLEIHDFLNQPAFVLLRVWYNNFAVNCRSGNAKHVPDPITPVYKFGTVLQKTQEHRFTSPQDHLVVFKAYDHLVKHIASNWEISNCKPQDGFRIWSQHAAAFAPEVNVGSTNIKYVDGDGKENGLALINHTNFFASVFGCCSYGLFERNWMDSDGSLSLRGKPTILGSHGARDWWHLGDRPGECDDFNMWEFPMVGCDAGDRHIAYTTLYNKHVGKSDGFKLVGSITHFGRNGQVFEQAPSKSNAKTFNYFNANHSMPIGGELDVVGPHNHAQYGGWYYWDNGGTPTHLISDIMAVKHDSVLILAASLPPGTPTSQVQVYAEIFGAKTGKVNKFTKKASYTQASSVDEVRNSLDKFFHDTVTDTVYWRIIDVYVVDSTTGTGPTAVWKGGTIHNYVTAITNYEEESAFVRAGLRIPESYRSGNYGTVTLSHIINQNGAKIWI